MAAQYENGKLVTGKPIIKDLGLRGSGRPTKYTPELLTKAQEYAYREHETVPTIAGLCLHLRISQQTLHTWINENSSQELSEIVKDIHAIQEDRLVTGALSKQLDSGMSRFLLASKHAYNDSQQQPGINVSITRDSVEISHKNQTLSIDTTDKSK